MKNGNGKQKQRKQQPLSRRPIRRAGSSPIGALPASYVEPFVAGSPRIRTLGRKTIIAHSEQVDSVTMNQYVFNVNNNVSTGYACQPARSQMWAWMGSNVGRAFETYRIRKLEFEYRAQVGTAHDGFVAMTFDFDTRDSAPQSLQQLLGNEVKYENPVYLPGRMSVPSAELSKLGQRGQLYTRYTASGAIGGDLKTYDAGRLWVFVGGSLAADHGKVCGLVIVHYEIEFETPQLNIPAQTKQSTLRITGNSSISKTSPFGSAPVIEGGLEWSAGNATLTINEPGQYLIDALVTGTGLTTGAVTLVAGDTSRSSVSTPVDIANSGGTLEALTFLINQPGVQSAIYTLAGAGATTVTALILRCARYSPSSTQTVSSSTGVVDILNEVPLAHED